MQINEECLPENYSTFFYRDLYRRFPHTFLVAKADGEIHGYIMCRIETGFSMNKRLSIVKKGHIISIAVLPNFRRIGIASALISEILERALPEYEVDECYLEVRPSNIAAINLYKTFSFKKVKEINHYYRDGETAYVMHFNLIRAR